MKKKNRHLQGKKSTGRPKGSGAYAGITPDMDWWDVQERMSGTPYPKFNARIVYLWQQAHWRTFANATGSEARQHRAAENEVNRTLREHAAARQAAMTAEEWAERVRKRDAEAKAHGRETYWNSPAGKSTDETADDIFKALDAAGEINSVGKRQYQVLDRRFASIENIKDAIRHVANQLKFAVRKQPRRKRKRE